MSKDYERVVCTVIDELNMGHLDINTELLTLDVEEYLSKKRKPKILLSSTKHNTKMDVDPNGIPLLNYNIRIFMNRQEITKLTKMTKSISNNWKIRIKDYLNGLGVKLRDESDFVLLLLHELGHINQIELFRQTGRLEQYTHTINVMNNTVKLAFGVDSIIQYNTETGRELNYQLRFSELNADNFMYMNFPRVWNRLFKEKIF